jgi:hypothetical protein
VKAELMADQSQLVESLIQNRVVPFIGSGVSMSVRVDGKALFPSWGELLTDIANQISDEDEQSMVRIHLKSETLVRGR